MQVEQSKWTETIGWHALPGRGLPDADIILVFGSVSVLKEAQHLKAIKQAYPRAHLFGCSTAGEIHDVHVSDDSLVATAVQFESTRVQGAQIAIDNAKNSLQAGEQLAKAFDREGLVHVLVLSDGLNVNGSELVRGLTSQLPAGVTVTGGLAGDGDRFGETLVFWDREPQQNSVAGVGLYGSKLKVGFGSLGGWDPFGPERLVTRSRNNILYELDGQSALELYKRYLGEHAQNLPASGLLFPLTLRTSQGETPIVRTILAVNEDEHSLTFAGDVPEGAYARLMRANFDRLIDGAAGAARTCFETFGSSTPELALLISCVGRKMILKQRIEEEVEGVREVLGEQPAITGFYSYGEISPFTPGAKCELHNQTMTITTLTER